MFALTAPKAEEVLDLSLADPFDGVPELFLTELRARSLDVRSHKYPSKIGEIELKEAIALDYFRKYRVELDPDTDIVVTNGAWGGLRDALNALGWLGCPVCFAEPAFSGFYMIIRALGMRPCPVPLEALLGDPDKVEKIFAQIAGALFILNSPHNPSGVVASPDQLHLIASLARAYGVRIISDFVYGDLFEGSRPDSFLMHDAAALEVSSLSKTFRMAGWRIGWVAGKGEGINAVSKLRSNLENGVPPALQLAASSLVRNQEEVDDFRCRVAARRKLLIDELPKFGFQINSGSSATNLVWAHIPAGFTSSNDIARLLKFAGVAVLPGSSCGQLGEGYLRFAANYPPPLLRVALGRIAKVAPLWLSKSDSNSSYI